MGLFYAEDGTKHRSLHQFHPLQRSPHIVILQHGVNGSPRDLRLLRSFLTERSAATADMLIVFDTDINAGLRTHHGLEECSRRLEAELIPQLLDFAEACASSEVLRRPTLSVVGHSFGGIILREFVARFCADPVLAHGYDLAWYVSIATPHTGVEHSSWSLAGALVRLASAVGSLTATELIVSYKSGVLDKHLIDDAHVNALGCFRRRLLVAPVDKDKLVSFQSATLQPELSPADMAIIARQPRLTQHCLPMSVLRPETVPVALQELAESGSVAATIALRLRQHLSFDTLPVVSDSCLHNAHSATVSKRQWSSMWRMDDVSLAVARCITQQRDVPLLRDNDQGIAPFPVQGADQATEQTIGAAYSG